MVVIVAPAIAATEVTQERWARPLILTVQAPHCAIPQPNLVPVKPSCSRITDSTGVLGSTSSDWVSPLRLKVTIN